MSTHTIENTVNTKMADVINLQSRRPVVADDPTVEAPVLLFSGSATVVDFSFYRYFKRIKLIGPAAE